MKPRENLKLRKVGKNYMVVEACAGNVRLTDVFSLNETAADLWQRMCEGDYTPAELAEWMCHRYEVPAEVALADVEKQLAEWKRFGLMKE